MTTLRDPADGEAAAKRQRVGSWAENCLNQGCRSVQCFRKLNRIDEGTYGVVYRACEVDTGEVVALKQLKLGAVKSEDGFPVSSIREISLLLELNHPNVVQCREVVLGNTMQHVYMVMEYVEHELKVLITQQRFAVAELKCLLRQLLLGLAHLHAQWIVHRDLKTSNILLDRNGILKICDFGLARHFGQPLRPYTHRVQSLWYRAPELLLGQRTYSNAIDVWSCGCIFAEMLLRRPVFEGKAELHQLGLIVGLVGLPDEESWPGCSELPHWKMLESFKDTMPGWRELFPEPPESALSELGLLLLRGLLECCPARRLAAADAVEHPYFQEVPQPQEPSMLPTFKAPGVADLSAMSGVQ